MKRILVTLVLIASAAAALVAAGAGGDADRAGRFTVELDNAFGLVEGGDLKIAGVRAGTIKKMRVDEDTKRALVDFEITKRGFGSLRTDAFCESRPQSLIGEYFLDCAPGTAPKELRPGSKIPVERTASTVPVDLLNNVLRRPYRERLRIILDELGAGVGGRAEDLNAAIRRLSPALRETNKTLRLLGDQNATIVQLTDDADTVIGDLADNKEDVGRWVVEAGQTATASAERRRELAAGFRKLLGFLRELRPTMAELGRTADAQIPTLVDLNASAGELERLFTNLEPFSESSQVNLRSLARAADAGRPAVRSAGATVAELAKVATNLPELANNLAIILEHLDDREFAVEKDPRSPGGQGYTGLEALLQYPFDNALAINTFDDNGYILKVNAFEDQCAAYQNADSLKKKEKEHPGFIKECASWIGANQPGVTTPDPTLQPSQARRASRSGREDDG
ncbi:MAG: MlaD family protein, partial [Actinomycetota bacterium]|nr:MlaD family protein [Actinomycetota bacterium]